MSCQVAFKAQALKHLFKIKSRRPIIVQVFYQTNLSITLLIGRHIYHHKYSRVLGTQCQTSWRFFWTGTLSTTPFEAFQWYCTNPCNIDDGWRKSGMSLLINCRRLFVQSWLGSRRSNSGSFVLWNLLNSNSKPKFKHEPCQIHLVIERLFDHAPGETRGIPYRQDHKINNPTTLTLWSSREDITQTVNLEIPTAKTFLLFFHGHNLQRISQRLPHQWRM